MIKWIFLPVEAYRQIAEMSIALYRLGLTAVYEQEDCLHALLPDFVGGQLAQDKSLILDSYSTVTKLRCIIK